MIKTPYAFLACLIFSSFFGSLSAQEPVLRTENGVHPVPDDIEERLEEGAYPDRGFENKVHALLTFNETPDANDRERMEAQGLRFIQYLPEKSYIVGYDRGTDLHFLLQHEARSIQPIQRAFRSDVELLREPYPAYAVQGDMIELQLSLFSDIPYSNAVRSISQSLSELGGDAALIRKLEASHRVELRIPQDELPAFSMLPSVEFVEPIDPEPTPDDRTGRSLHRSNVINGKSPGGLRYNGDSIVMAIADDGGIGPHIDFEGRMTDHTGGLGGDHGDMTAGIAVGAGNLEPRKQGMAPGAHLHMYDISGYPHINNAVSNLNNLGTRITSTSYSQGCNDYDSDAENADDQIHQNPELIHVFSAGNSASDDCGYGASGWGNITGGTKQGKNVIATGNLDHEDNLVSSSSRGPAEDGRIKPELCANGGDQLSTDEGNVYQVGGGTSAASPGLAGVIAQLYDAYQEMNAGAFPSSALIKASLLNTAEDLDDPGPDFNTGWGRINASRAYRILRDGRYQADTVDQGATNSHSISVPAGVEQVRVMVYWADPAGSPAAAQALVNDLNIELTTPGGTTYDPWILDHTASSAALDAPATRGRDSINNMEQVTLSSPSSGTYNLDVEGYNVPQGPQAYYLVYEFMGEDGVELTYPRGGEGFVPNTTEKLRWDAYGDGTDFDLSYSTDSGNTWSNIATGVSGSRRYYDWTVPNTVSGEAFVRITRGGEVDTNDAPFAMIDTASSIDFEWVCPDSLLITWDSVQGAIGYEIHQLGNEYMDSIGTSSDTSYKVMPFDPSQDHWFSVNAIAPDSMEGRRARAVKYQGGNTVNCPLDTNLRLWMLDPLAGGVPSCNADSVPVRVKVKNVGFDSVQGFTTAYNINGGPSTTMAYNDTLAPDSMVTLTFSDSVEVTTLSKDVQAWVDHPDDPDALNDSSQVVSVQEFSSSLFSFPYDEDMEGQTICEGDHDDCTHSCSLQDGLVNLNHPQVDDIDWRVGQGSTPSSNTGPSSDFDPGTNTGNYLYLEPSYGCEEQEGSLLTPCIDISGSSPMLTYAYHMYGSDMGELHVDVLVDGTWHTDVRTPISGDQGSGWNPDTIDLSAYQGDRMTVRFRGITGDDFHSDIAIDGIEVFDGQAAPSPAFTGEPQNLCVGQVAELFDGTVGLVDSLVWHIDPGNYNFVNGTDRNSPNPDLSFSANGTYEVKLLAYNGGNKDSLVKSQFITVGPNASAPLTEDFQNAQYPPYGWMVDDPGGNYTWEEASGIVGNDGLLTQAATVKNYSYDNSGVEDDLVTEIVDISGVDNPILTFDVAYVRYSSNYYDGLKVRVSNDCGASYSTEYNKNGNQLSTASDNENDWSPSSSDHWRKDTVDLSAFQGSQELRIRFVNVNGYGNNLYLDNINLPGKSSSLEERSGALALNVYPNPVKDRLQVDGTLQHGSDLRFRIEDMRGRKVKATERSFGQGSFKTQLDVSGLEEGVYFLKTRPSKGETRVSKFVVER